MKKMLLVTAIVIAAVVNANAMSYERARSEALFLTDKMAYELDLTNYQYNAVYEINLDYFNGLIGTTDIFGINWSRRANELGYVLTSWQYKLFLDSEYFYRPVALRKSVLYFTIYDRYARDRFFRPAPPKVYAHYRAGSRKYHEKPHNNMHFADNHHKNGHHNLGDRPKGNHGNKPGNSGNVGGNKPSGNHNRNLGNHNSGNVNATDKPAKVNPGNTVRSTHSETPARRSTVNAGSNSVRRSTNNAGSNSVRRSTDNAGSSTGRRSR